MPDRLRLPRRNPAGAQFLAGNGPGKRIGVGEVTAPEIPSVGRDLAKRVFQVYEADASGQAVLHTKPRRDQGRFSPSRRDHDSGPAPACRISCPRLAPRIPRPDEHRGEGCQMPVSGDPVVLTAAPASGPAQRGRCRFRRRRRSAHGSGRYRPAGSPAGQEGGPAWPASAGARRSGPTGPRSAGRTGRPDRPGAQEG